MHCLQGFLAWTYPPDATSVSEEGTLNKFLIDDKGMLFLLAYGLPPLAPRSVFFQPGDTMLLFRRVRSS